MKSKVYFTSIISKESILNIYKALSCELKGNVAIKIHSGELGNQNFIKPEMYEEIVKHIGGTIVETNTAYEGARNTTEKHLELLREHGWSKYYNVDILDSEPEDIVLNINNGNILKKNYVGKNMIKYNSTLVISHFKGHPMGGYGGALKQLAIGYASSKGKRYIHCTGKEDGSYADMFKSDQNMFLESMADAAKSIIEYFDKNIVCINILANISVDCDCCSIAKDPCIKDIGILASTDPVAIDQACIDLVYNSKEPGKKHIIERIESKNGIHIIEAAFNLKLGSRDYELINID